jgi:ABC-type branched-subunit amino acid transport system substrate-binding protein/outer membrane protein assembly factor BamD (BamD/ComL family)
MIVGMAFLFAGCQPGRTIWDRIPEERAAADAFDRAERYYKAELYDKALEQFERYVRENPDGEKTRTALYRMGEIYYKQERYEQALIFFQRIIDTYPEDPTIPTVRYDIANTYFRMGLDGKAQTEALVWLESYPDHSLKGEVQYLLGRIQMAAGDKPRTFSWWIKASESLPVTSQRRHDIDRGITELLRSSSLDDLIAMRRYADGSPHRMPLLRQIAVIYLGQNKLKEAREIASELIQSTQDQQWIMAGHEILAEIDEKLSFRKGAVGCLLPLSGPFSIYGQEILNGIQLGMGLSGVSEQQTPIQLVIRDTKGEAEEAVAGVAWLVEREKVMAIIGPLASKPAAAAAEKAQELGVPIITLTQREAVTTTGDMVFRNFLTPSRQVKTLVAEAVNEMGLRRFAVLYPDNPYGRYFMELFWEEVEGHGGAITAVESYNPEETDFAVQIKKMVGLYYPRPASVKRWLAEIKTVESEWKETPDLDLDEEPIVDFDAVFVPDNPDRVAMITPQFPFHNVFHVRFLGTNLWQSNGLLEQAGKYIRGSIFPSGYFHNEEDSGTTGFHTQYREAFEAEPTVLAASGYDTIRLLKHLVDTRNLQTRRDLQRALRNTDGFFGVTGPLSFDEQGEVEKEPALLTVTGNRFQRLR